MIPTAKIKYIRSLQQKKFRRQYGVFVAEGEKIVGELVSACTAPGGEKEGLSGGGLPGGENPGPFRLECICALQEWMDQYGMLLPHGLETHVVSPAELGRISGLSTPNRVLAVARTPEYGWTVEDVIGGPALLLDGIQDPGNMGTIIRTADWFGIRRVFCSPDSADVFSPKVVQSTMGSFLRVRTIYTGLAGVLGQVPEGKEVYGAFPDGTDLTGLRPAVPPLMIIGNESRGISRELLPFITGKVRIPGAQDGPESLNASVAAGILMAWMRVPR
jgi:RNA methyltransferase, TrmH family